MVDHEGRQNAVHCQEDEGISDEEVDEGVGEGVEEAACPEPVALLVWRLHCQMDHVDHVARSPNHRYLIEQLH